MGGGRNWLRTVTYSLFALSSFLSLFYFSSFLTVGRSFFATTLHPFLHVCIFLCVPFLPHFPFSFFRLKGSANHSLWTSIHYEQKASWLVMYHTAPKPQFRNTNSYLGPRRHLNKVPYWAQCSQDIYHRMFHVTSHLVSWEFPHKDTELRFQHSRGMYSVLPLSERNILC
jgi:hypothetical protein